MPFGVVAAAATATFYARHNAVQHAQQMPEKQSSRTMIAQILTLMTVPT